MKLAPMGDPMELRIHGYELTLRLEDARKIEAALGGERKPEGRQGVGTTEDGQRKVHPERSSTPALEKRASIIPREAEIRSRTGSS